MKQALIVFAKPPVPGQVKTRLTTLLTEEDAARLYAAFLADALTQYQRLDAEVRLYLSPTETPVALDVPAGVTVAGQQGEGLGARMKRAFVETFAAGYDHLVIIGTDHPTLPTPFIEQAFAALADPLALSIGPSDDGGYYLLGMNDLYAVLFDDMAYSHAGVFEETLRRATHTGARLTVLPAWYDVDTPEALRRLVDELDADPRRPPAAETRRAVAALQARYPALR